jgi:hypothetical protein
MKLTEYLVFAVLLIPTLVVIVAAVVSLAGGAKAAPEYHPPMALASSAGLYPADMTTDE